VTLYTESSDGLVTLAAASIVTGWSEPVPGREFHPLKSSAFHGALLRQSGLGFSHPDGIHYEGGEFGAETESFGNCCC